MRARLVERVARLGLRQLQRRRLREERAPAGSGGGREPAHLTVRGRAVAQQARVDLQCARAGPLARLGVGRRQPGDEAQCDEAQCPAAAAALVDRADRVLQRGGGVVAPPGGRCQLHPQLDLTARGLLQGVARALHAPGEVGHDGAHPVQVGPGGVRRKVQVDVAVDGGSGRLARLGLGLGRGRVGRRAGRRGPARQRRADREQERDRAARRTPLHRPLFGCPGPVLDCGACASAC